MSEKLKKLIEYRDTIILAEIGALIHDLGKLSEEFVRSKCIEESGKKWIHHTAIIELDVHRGVKYANDIRRILKNVKININQKTIALYDFILGHHPKNWGRKEKWDKPESFEFEYPAYDEDSILLKFIIASDTFDSEEDKSYCKDPQSVCGIYKSTSFGFEEEVIVPKSLKDERVKIYKILRDWLDSCSIIDIIDKRLETLNKIKEPFSKTLGETRRSANDVTLWDHSYMTASMMKSLLAQYILCKYFENEDNCKEFLKEVERRDIAPKQIITNTKPFKIFSVGWNLFEFLKQSHRIPDVIGRIKILEEIKNSIRKIVEEKYALGNSIYEDDFGIYFLIPSVLSDNDLKEVKERIFDVFNEKIKGLLLPVFHLEETNSKEEFRIGKLLSGAIAKIKEKIRKHEINLIKTPAWINRWRSSVELPKEKLICNVCGKGYYCKGDDEKICKTCKDVRNKGRIKEISQTVFIDEIAWNSDKRQYENVCLLIAKFDLDEWLNGRFVRSLFIRKLDTTIADYYDIVRSYCEVYLLYEKLYNKFKELKEKQEDENTKREKLIKICDEFGEEDVKKFLKHIGGIKKDIIDSLPEKPEKLIKEISKLNLPSEDKKTKNRRRYIAEYIGKDTCSTLFKILKDFEFEEEAIINAYVFSKGDRLLFLSYLYQKPSSPSRLMRIWNNTKEFFEEVAKLICLSVPVISEYKLTLENEIDDLIPNMAYLLEIENDIVGEVISLKEKSKELFVITPHMNDYLLKNKGELRGKKIVLRHPDSKRQVGKGKIKEIVENGRTVRAYRIISISPMLFMAIIPASKSWEIVKNIQEMYMKNFGKVFGKLPLHIGLIYFKRKMPMFAVLDSAMRMVSEFESLKEESLSVCKVLKTDGDGVVLELRPTEDGLKSFKYIVKIPYKLGDGNLDYYHPYLIVENSSDDVIEIKIDDKLIVQKHVSKIKEDDKIKVKKCYFDFEFLDSNIRRFDIGVKRKHWLFTESENKPKPYLLWDTDNFERLRKLIKKLGLTTTQIMNLYEMLMSKLEEWNLRSVRRLRDDEAFKKLVDNAIKDIPLRLEIVDGESGKNKISKEDYEFLKDTILTGLFFDFVDLWHTILKKEFEGGEDEGV